MVTGYAYMSRKRFDPNGIVSVIALAGVDRNPLPIITDAIKKKSNELDRYRSAAGADVRLLLVADRIHNSGKLMLDDTATLDTQGFHAIYVFPYPEHVRVFGEKFDAA